ncbi:MAG: glycosyltransferase family 4 protein [Chloroflexota bacterium]|nr:glycosyltransferase family 4 protein [Chloroflexota bacterium]
MKVAFLSYHYAEYCVRLANALARDAEVLLLLADWQSSPHYISGVDRAVNFRLFSKPRYRQPLRQIWLVYTLLQHIRHFDPDVVHFQQGHLWFNLALPLLKRYPLVLTIHDPKPHVGDKESGKTPRLIVNYGFHRATEVIVHGEQQRQLVVDQLRIPNDIVHVIRPVPDIVFSDDVAQNQVEEDDRLILFFGRIWEYKGLEYLIRAEPLNTAQVPDAKIMIAGRGEDFARYQRMMVHPEHFIVYNEYVPDDKLVELFRSASMVVLPYIDASISGVIPVAYTFAKPVIATTVGILPEMVDHGRTGYVVPPRDVRALADAIVSLLRDKELRHQMGVNGKRKLDAEFSPDVVARQTLPVYQRAINRMHSSAGTRKSGRPGNDTPSQ